MKNKILRILTVVFCCTAIIGIFGNFGTYAIGNDAPDDSNDETTTVLIHYDANNGTGETEDQEVTLNSFNQYIRLEQCPFKRAGFYCNYWSVDPNGNGTYYDAPDLIKGLPDNKTEITLYAMWTPVNSGIAKINDSYSGNSTCISDLAGGWSNNKPWIGLSAANEYYYYRNDVAEKSYKDLQQEKIEFSLSYGYFDSDTKYKLHAYLVDEDTGEKISAAGTDAYTEFTSDDAGSGTVSLTFDAMLYTKDILKEGSWKLDEDALSAVTPEDYDIASLTYKYGRNIIVCDEITDEDGNVVSEFKYNGSLKDEPTAPWNRRIHLLANEVKEVPKVIIHFDANGGEGTMEDQITEQNVETVLSKNTFIRKPEMEYDQNGVLGSDFTHTASTIYKFIGWSDNKNYGSGSVTVTPDNIPNFYTDEGSITTDKDITLYAVWEPMEICLGSIESLSDSFSGESWNSNNLTGEAGAKHYYYDSLSGISADNIKNDRIKDTVYLKGLPVNKNYTLHAKVVYFSADDSTGYKEFDTKNADEYISFNTGPGGDKDFVINFSNLEVWNNIFLQKKRDTHTDYYISKTTAYDYIQYVRVIEELIDENGNVILKSTAPSQDLLFFTGQTSASVSTTAFLNDEFDGHITEYANDDANDRISSTEADSLSAKSKKLPKNQGVTGRTGDAYFVYTKKDLKETNTAELKKDKIQDNVVYSGLDKNISYTVHGVLMDADTGEKINVPGSDTYTNLTTDDTGSGEITVTFDADLWNTDFLKTDKTAQYPYYRNVVVYEEILDTDKNIVGEHKDLTDAKQMVHLLMAEANVSPLAFTGGTEMEYVIISVILCTAYLTTKRRNHL